MDKYVLYVWTADDEGGYGICPADQFTRNTGYHPESGWRARPSVKIGTFNNANELATLLYEDDPEYMVSPLIALTRATDMLNSYLEMEAEV